MKVTITLEDKADGSVAMKIDLDPKATTEELNRSIAARAGLAVDIFLKEKAVMIDQPQDASETASRDDLRRFWRN